MEENNGPSKKMIGTIPLNNLVKKVMNDMKYGIKKSSIKEIGYITFGKEKDSIRPNNTNNNVINIISKLLMELNINFNNQVDKIKVILYHEEEE